MSAWIEQNARRGLPPRQERLLSLEALVEGTGYDHLEAWDAEDEKGNPLPCCKRRPEVQIGIIADKCLTLVRNLSGVGKAPTLDGCESIAAELQQLKLRESLPLAVKDLVVKGAGALGFARLSDATKGPFEPLYLDVVWCEPLFGCHAATSRAEQLRAELAAAGIPLAAPAKGDFLAVPEGVGSHDLIFLRHEWVVDTEVSRGVGASATDTVRTRYRRDYLPNAIVEYVPIRIGSDDETPKAWKPILPVRPHNWGRVPIKWARSPWAKPGDTEGPTFIRPEVRSLSRAADYTESLATDSVKKIAWPQLAQIDATDPRRDINREMNPGVKEAPMSSSSSEVISVNSRPGTTHQAQLKILEINGDGPKVAAEHVTRLKGHVDQLTGMTDFDQSEAAGTLSGEALERIMEPKIATVGEWRGPVEDLLVGVAELLAHVTKREIAPEVKWSDFIKPTPPDKAQLANALAAATGNLPFVSQATATRIWAQANGIADVEAEVKALEKDAKAALDEARAAMAQRGADAAAQAAADAAAAQAASAGT